MVWGAKTPISQFSNPLQAKFHGVVLLKGNPHQGPDNDVFKSPHSCKGALSLIRLRFSLWAQLKIDYCRFLVGSLQLPFKTLGVPSPFFPGILLSTRPPKTLEKQLVLEKNDG